MSAPKLPGAGGSYIRTPEGTLVPNIPAQDVAEQKVTGQSGEPKTAKRAVKKAAKKEA